MSFHSSVNYKSESFLGNLLVINSNETLLGGCNVVFIAILHKSLPYTAHWGALLHFPEGEVSAWRGSVTPNVNSAAEGWQSQDVLDFCPRGS